MQTVMKSLLEMTASISLSNRAQGDPVPCYARAGRAQGKIHKFPFRGLMFLEPGPDVKAKRA